MILLVQGGDAVKLGQAKTTNRKKKVELQDGENTPKSTLSDANYYVDQVGYNIFYIKGSLLWAHDGFMFVCTFFGGYREVNISYSTIFI